MYSISKKLKGFVIIFIFIVFAVAAIGLSGTNIAAEAATATIVPIGVPETGLDLPPAIVQTLTANSDIDNLSGSKKPQVLLVDVDSDMNAVDGDGEALFNISTNNKIPQYVIPAYNAKDAAAGTALNTYLSGRTIIDAFIVSSDAEVLKTVRTGNGKTLRGVLEVTQDIKAAALAAKAHAAYAKIVILPAEYADREYVFELQKRAIAVWVRCETRTDIFTALTSGAEGIISGESKAVIEIIEDMPRGFFRTPNVIGHRGLMDKYQENTISGARAVKDAGAHAIELDIYVTTDDKLVVMHDKTIDRTTTGTGEVESYSSTQLASFKVDSIPSLTHEPIPFLDEFFEEFKNDDLIIHIEIKTDKTKAIALLKAMIEEYDFADRVLFSSFNINQVILCRQQMPEIGAAYINEIDYQNQLSETEYVRQILEKTSQYSLSHNPGRYCVNASRLKHLQYRGVQSIAWTYNTGNYATSLPSEFAKGYYGMTMNDVTQATGFYAGLEGNYPLNIGTEELQAMELYSDVYDVKGTKTKVLCELYEVSKQKAIQKTEDGYYAPEGDYEVILMYKTNKDYTVFSEVVTVHAKARGAVISSASEAFSVDYKNETIMLKAGVEASTEQDFSSKIESGTKIEPGISLLVRYAETPDEYAGPITIFRIAARPQKPATPENIPAGADKITLSVTGGLEYKLGDDGTWQDTPEWTGLSAGEYTIYYRVKATDKAFSSVEGSLTVSPKGTSGCNSTASLGLSGIAFFLTLVGAIAILRKTVVSKMN